MAAITCTRILEFDAGHRVVGHEGKCLNAHGHRYKVQITCRAAELDSVGRVIDFGAIKQLVGTWIDRNWDHAMILWEEDRELIDFLVSQGHAVYRLPWNPTAENMARYLLVFICPQMLAPKGIQAIKVRIWETPNCFADATIPESSP